MNKDVSTVYVSLGFISFLFFYKEKLSEENNYAVKYYWDFCVIINHLRVEQKIS
jgi:hypothetical protein